MTPKDNTKRFPSSLLQPGDPDNYLTRVIRWLEKKKGKDAKATSK